MRSRGERSGEWPAKGDTVVVVGIMMGWLPDVLEVRVGILNSFSPRLLLAFSTPGPRG